MSRRKKQLDVLGLGCAAVDELVYVPHYPPADAKLAVADLQRQCGGLTARALLAAARLGVRCAYAGTIGNDDASQFVLRAFSTGGVDTRSAIRQPRVRPLRSLIVVDQTRHTRTIFYDANQATGAHPHRPDRDLIAASRVLLVDRFGVPGMIRAARIARAAGVPVVADFENDHWDGFATLFSLPDHLIVSETFARQVTRKRAPAAAVTKLWSPDRAVVVVTCGGGGCWYRDATITDPVHLPAFRIQAVDTTGCGDVFHGAYAAALARGLPLPERLRLAAATAAWKASRPGHHPQLPTWRQVRQFMNKENPDQR